MGNFKFYAVIAAIIAVAVAGFALFMPSKNEGLTNEEKAARAREGKAAKQTLRFAEKEISNNPVEPE